MDLCCPERPPFEGFSPPRTQPRNPLGFTICERTLRRWGHRLGRGGRGERNALAPEVRLAERQHRDQGGPVTQRDPDEPLGGRPQSGFRRAACRDSKCDSICALSYDVIRYDKYSRATWPNCPTPKPNKFKTNPTNLSRTNPKFKHPGKRRRRATKMLVSNKGPSSLQLLLILVTIFEIMWRKSPSKKVLPPYFFQWNKVPFLVWHKFKQPPGQISRNPNLTTGCSEFGGGGATFR